MRGRESGFTLIELMVAVVVLGILAAIALPAFFGETRKVKAAAEVQPMFNDLRVRLEQAMQENGAYPATIGEATMYPTNPGPPPWDLTTNALPGTWTAIKVRISGADQLLCSYTWATGLANKADNIGTIASTSFAFTAPATDWYYLLAKCDMDSNTAAYSYYFSSSVDATVKKFNEGK
jgi:prepilin-type N-terminal cleavage/methylation domain-containing protein